MFRAKRDDTLVGTIEKQYGIDLHARSDMTLGTLLDERGFDSLTQLLQAYRGRLTYHARRRRLFLSFHAEDKPQVQGFRLMAHNPNVELDFYDGSLQVPANSERATYIRSIIRERIRRASVLVCLIGNGTAWRDWVDWELSTGVELGKGLCGVRLKGSRGQTPPMLVKVGAPIARWNLEQIVAAIECAAARRS
ncbi:MAG TPA: TIR domain-containing protein [Terriglobia bacterium]|jgi:hypothetical protein|nr:TIR domain-containing protein [Terriglobia bacterium]